MKRTRHTVQLQKTWITWLNICKAYPLLIDSLTVRCAHVMCTGYVSPPEGGVQQSSPSRPSLPCGLLLLTALQTFSKS